MEKNQSVLGTICSQYNTFFDAEKKIADCVMEQREAVVDMTVAELAKASGTSDATVSRFCRRCGFGGFHQLKLTLAREVAAEKHHAMQVSNDILRDDILQSLQNILANKIAELTQTLSQIDPAELEAILTLLENARSIQVAAVGNTIPVALDFAFKLNQLGIAAVSGTIWETQMAYTLNLGSSDVLVVISNSGSSRRLVKLIEGAREKGCKVIAITNNPKSAIARLSHRHLTTATRDKLLLGDFCFSRVSATVAVEMLYLFLAVGKQDSESCVRRHEMAIAEDKDV